MVLRCWRWYTPVHNLPPHVARRQVLYQDGSEEGGPLGGDCGEISYGRASNLYRLVNYKRSSGFGLTINSCSMLLTGFLLILGVENIAQKVTDQKFKSELKPQNNQEADEKMRAVTLQ